MAPGSVTSYSVDMLVRLAATFDRLEYGKAVFILEDGQELRVAREIVNPTPEAGTAFALQLLPEQEAALDREALAKTLLNQLLRPDDVA